MLPMSKRSSPIRPVLVISLWKPSSCLSVDGIHDRALFGQHEPQPREPFEHPAHQHVHQRAVGEERDLRQHDEGHGHVLAVVGLAAARVAVDHHAELVAHRPQGVVPVGVERVDVLGVRGHRGHEDAAPQVVLLDPADVGDRLVDVVEEDLPDPGALQRVLVAPVGEPAVVGADPGEPELEIVR